MLKKLIILLFIALPVSMVAQDKLAYINANEIMSQMPELGEIESELAKKREEIQKNTNSMEEEYRRLLEKFQETPTEELTESVILDREKQLQQLQERYQTYQENSYNEFQELQGKLVAPVQQKIQKAIQEVGAEQGYTYVFDVATLLYLAPNAVDAGPFVKTKLGI